MNCLRTSQVVHSVSYRSDGANRGGRHHWNNFNYFGISLWSLLCLFASASGHFKLL